MSDDPFRDRQPTSHERLSGRPWDASYQDGPAPWDVGTPQPAIVQLASAGGFTGSVLDAGCGTGENALHLASLGLRVLGVDVAETALDAARTNAASRGFAAEFSVADALDLARWDEGSTPLWIAGCFTPSMRPSGMPTSPALPR